jgi:hypothetical protein
VFLQNSRHQLLSRIIELFSFRKFSGIGPHRWWTGFMRPVLGFIKWQPSKSWSTTVIKTAEGVSHLLILAVDLAMDGAQQLTDWQRRAMTQRWRHWGVVPKLLLARYGGWCSTMTSLNQSYGHRDPYPGLLDLRWSLEPHAWWRGSLLVLRRRRGLTLRVLRLYFLVKRTQQHPKMAETVTVWLGMSSGGRAVSWHKARVRGSILIHKCGQEASFYTDFLSTTSEGCNLQSYVFSVLIQSGFGWRWG